MSLKKMKSAKTQYRRLSKVVRYNRANGWNDRQCFMSAVRMLKRAHKMGWINYQSLRKLVVLAAQFCPENGEISPLFTLNTCATRRANCV